MADVITKIARDVAEALAPRLAAAGAAVTADWPDRPRDMPPGRGVVAVGLQDAEAVPLALADYLGEDERGGVYGRTLDVTVSLLACAPPANGGAGCQALFALLCDALLFDLAGYDVRRVWCGKAAYQRELGALALPCYARLRLQLVRGAQESGATEFIVRRVEACKTI